MSIISTHHDDRVTLEIDKGDLSHLLESLYKWSFKDYQSLIRFSLSMLVLNENKHFTVKIDGVMKDIVPADDYLTSKEPIDKKVRLKVDAVGMIKDSTWLDQEIRKLITEATECSSSDVIDTLFGLIERIYMRSSGYSWDDIVKRVNAVGQYLKAVKMSVDDIGAERVEDKPKAKAVIMDMANVTGYGKTMLKQVSIPMDVMLQDGIPQEEFLEALLDFKKKNFLIVTKREID